MHHITHRVPRLVLNVYHKSRTPHSLFVVVFSEQSAMLLTQVQKIILCYCRHTGNLLNLSQTHAGFQISFNCKVQQEIAISQ